ncbi:hypothetical protein G6L78_01320 [Agrobacterium rhizogenes]|nr:hypothetical protein [Rhizobium rhizogenes]
MPEAIRLYIITENPVHALAQTLGCAPTNAPTWVRVLSDPEDILRTPNGAKCIAVWFSSRKFPSDAEKAWRERRLMDGIQGLADEDWVKLQAWIDRRRAQPVKDIQNKNADIPQSDETESRDIPPSIIPQPEIRNLVQTQRWT